MRTLVLNKNWMPIKHVDWRKAFTLICKGSAEVVDNYEVLIRTPRDYYFMPAVIRLVNYAKIPEPRVGYSKRTLLERDDYTCQYCGKKLSATNATVDHVVPRFKGGKTTFENTVTACGKCNRDKGSKSVSEARLKLLSKPQVPLYTYYRLHLPKRIPGAWTAYIPKGMLDGIQVDD